MCQWLRARLSEDRKYIAGLCKAFRSVYSCELLLSMVKVHQAPYGLRVFGELHRGDL